MREKRRIITNKGTFMAYLDAGEKAPAFELPKAGGGSARLEDYLGSPTVLYFFCKDGGSACEQEAKDFSALKGQFDALGVKVAGISPDGPKTKERFRAKHAVTVDLLSDDTRTAAEAYGVWKEKSMYGRSYMGVERTTFLLDTDGRVVRVWPKVKVAGHAEEVLAAARSLLGRN
jgi:peroxiredoxin Q/BCP